jgi:hypothetical protein
VSGEEGVASLEIAMRCLEERPVRAASQRKTVHRAAG